MHNHGFRRILDNILFSKRDDLKSSDSHSRTVNQLKAASSASLEPQFKGASRFSTNGGYLVDTTKIPNEVVEDTCGDDPEPAGNAALTLQQLKQVLKDRPTRADLNRLRRSFALANHPDRASAASRERSSARLSVANSLIDEAYKNARR
jgi:hypothetical protein